MLNSCPALAEFQEPEGGAVKNNRKTCCWIKLNQNGSMLILLETLKTYGINLGDLLLSIKGSNIAIGFSVRGPIIGEAKKHSDVELLEQ
jgi:hypothetical protein